MANKAKNNFAKRLDRYRPAKIREDAARDYQRYRQTGQLSRPSSQLKQKTLRWFLMALLAVALLALLSVFAASR